MPFHIFSLVSPAVAVVEARRAIAIARRGLRQYGRRAHTGYLFPAMDWMRIRSRFRGVNVTVSDGAEVQKPGAVLRSLTSIIPDEHVH